MPFRWLPLLAFFACAHAAADEVVIYRCTDASGQVALRDTPCPKDQQQHTREMVRPQDPPPRPPAPTPAAAAPPPAPVVETRVVVLTPPRPLYECVTPDGDRYTSDTADGNPRWVPLWVAGYPPRRPRGHSSGLRLGDRVGAPRPPPPGSGPGPPELPPAVGLAYTPGTWVRDRCYALPQTEVCDRLRDRKHELERQWFNAMPSGREMLELEERDLNARLRNDCRNG